MATARQIIKQWFSNFKKPTQEQFWAWIDSFWHKEDKIPMQSVEGLENALQSVPTSDQFNNHINDGNAHQVLFDGKVDKEDGKGLISDAERNQIQINKNKQVVGHTITGDVNKVSTLLLDDGSVIQADFTDVAPAGPDVMLNSLNFNIQTGVLTGVRSDGQQLTVDLNGRYALLGHTHTIADVADLEDALNGKAEAGHTHAFSDLSGTEDIATKQEITDAVSGIKISSQNIYKGSLYLWGNDRLNSNNTEKGKIIVTGEHWNSYSWIKHTESNANFLSYDITNRPVSAGIFVKAPAGMKLVFELLVDYHNNGKTTEFISNGEWQWVKIENITKAEASRPILTGLYSKADNTILGEVLYKDFTIVFGNKAPEGFSPNVEDLVSKSELENVIDVTTINNSGDFKPKNPLGQFCPHISPTGNFSVFAGEIGSGELLMQVDRTFGIKSPKHIDGKVVSGRKLRVSVIDSSWVDLDSRNNELNVTNPSNENDYVSVKAKGFKTPNGSVNEVLRADGSTALFMKGEEISGSVSWTANNRVRGNTIFLTGNGNKTIHLHQLENHSIMSFKKCFDGGNIDFQCQGKTIIKRGADAFNGADGSNAVISIVGNKCYIDINNYE